MAKPADFYQKAAQLWLNQAGDNLKWAKNSFKGGFYTQTCFVCQQIAETAFYYAPTRYPEVLALPEYTQQTAKEAITLAQKILKFVQEKN